MGLGVARRRRSQQENARGGRRSSNSGGRDSNPRPSGYEFRFSWIFFVWRMVAPARGLKVTTTLTVTLPVEKSFDFALPFALTRSLYVPALGTFLETLARPGAVEIRATPLPPSESLP